MGAARDWRACGAAPLKASLILCSCCAPSPTTAAAAASTTAQPISCQADGRSASTAADSATDAIGWISSSSEACAAGSSRHAQVISIHPATCEVSASSASQPCPGQVGTRLIPPEMGPAMTHTTAHTALTSNSGPATRPVSPLPRPRRIRMNSA